MTHVTENNNFTLDIYEESNFTRWLKIGFDDALLKRLKETRYLMEILPIPLDIKEKALKGDAFRRYSIMLRKVGNLYNSIEESIIPEQRRMLSDMRMKILKVFNKPNCTSIETGTGSISFPMRIILQFQNASMCQTYIESLFEAIEKLQIENNKLRSLHKKLILLTSTLMSIDLYCQKIFWIRKWNEIHLIFSNRVL